MISLEKIKACTNPECRLVLPADPDDEWRAGFWVRERENGPGSRVRRWFSRCKGCAGASRGRGLRRRAESWMVEHEGTWVQARRCVNESCGTVGLCLDSPESTFHVKGRNDDGLPVHWASICRKCQAAEGRARREANRELTNARRRERHRERMVEDPEYVATRRTQARKYLADHPERRERNREINARWREKQRKLDPNKLRELERIDRVLRAERAGRPLRERPKADADSSRRFLAPGRFYDWFAAYSAAAGLVVSELAKSLEISERQCWEYENAPREWIEYDTVDRILLVASCVVEVDGRAVFGIDDLYPDDPGIPQSELAYLWHARAKSEKETRGEG